MKSPRARGKGCGEADISSNGSQWGRRPAPKRNKGGCHKTKSTRCCSKSNNTGREDERDRLRHPGSCWRPSNSRSPSEQAIPSKPPCLSIPATRDSSQDPSKDPLSATRVGVDYDIWRRGGCMCHGYGEKVQEMKMGAREEAKASFALSNHILLYGVQYMPSGRLSSEGYLASSHGPSPACNSDK